MVFLRAIITTLCAMGAGWLFASAGVPLGWLIGAMLVMFVASVLKLPARQPTIAVPYVKASVGTMLGASITAPVLAGIVLWWPSLLIMFVVMLIAGAANFATLKRFFGFSAVDAALCSVPGGITEMILMGEQAGGDARRVAIVHALRIAISILAIPLIAAWMFDLSIARDAAPVTHAMAMTDWLWFGSCVLVGVAAERWTRLPAPFILAPLVVSGGLHLSGVSLFEVPPVVSIAVQIVIGMNVGARFIGVSLRALGQVAASAIAVVGIQIALATLAALALAHWTDWDALALLLAYAPGGLAEMSLIAVTMGREVAFVGFHHILRVLFALSLAPILLHRLRNQTP